MTARRVLGISLMWALACGSDGESPVAAPPRPTTTEVAAPPEPVVEGELPPYYQTTLYTKDELRTMSLRTLQIRRNTIFARAGQPFRKKWLDDYFRQYDWYHPLTTVADDSKLSAIDRQNSTLIAEVEAGFTQDELRERKRKVSNYEDIPESWELYTDPDFTTELGLLSAALGEWEGDPSVPVEMRSPLQDPSVLDRPITEAQLADLSRRDLRILRNTIFARHGRAFKSELLQQYFAQKVWYDVDPNYTDASLTDIDRANIATIVAVEESMGGMMTEAQQATFEQEYFGGA